MEDPGGLQARGLRDGGLGARGPGVRVRGGAGRAVVLTRVAAVPGRGQPQPETGLLPPRLDEEAAAPVPAQEHHVPGVQVQGLLPPTRRAREHAVGFRQAPLGEGVEERPAHPRVGDPVGPDEGADRVDAPLVHPRLAAVLARAPVGHVPDRLVGLRAPARRAAEAGEGEHQAVLVRTVGQAEREPQPVVPAPRVRRVRLGPGTRARPPPPPGTAPRPRVPAMSKRVHRAYFPLVRPGVTTPGANGEYLTNHPTG